MTADEWDTTDRFREMIRAVTDPHPPPPPPPPSLAGRVRRLLTRRADPSPVPSRLNERQMRLIVAGCCRHREDWSDSDSDFTLLAAADLIERMADNALTDDDRKRLARMDEMRMRVHAPTAAEQAVGMVEADVRTFGLFAHLNSVMMADNLKPIFPDVSADGCDVVRCVVGNSFRPPVAFRPRWRSSAVVELATGFHAANDFGPMPVLADALQDAGCEDDRILSHCRAGRHVRGCWVIEAVRGTTKPPVR